MPNYGYHLARAEGRAIRGFYRTALPLIAQRNSSSSARLPFDVVSYSGERDLPEQVASIRSLLRHAGRPRKFTVVSDGTHSAANIALLRRIDPCVAIAQASDFVPSAAPEALRVYLRDHPTGKQLAVIMALPMETAVLYTDSDVLFFPGADQLARLVAEDNAPASYLPDCGLSADERAFRSEEERANPVNTGVLFLRRRLDWSLAISRFLELTGAPTFFTNQTLTHLTMHANGARPLDSGKFVLRLDDQFVHADRYAGPEIVLRHYVNPVRHKFWTALPR